MTVNGQLVAPPPTDDLLARLEEPQVVAFLNSPLDHADLLLGQPSFAANGENRWSSVGRDTLCWPYGLALRTGSRSRTRATTA